MKINSLSYCLSFSLFMSICIAGFCQVNEDAVMIANSNKWKVQQKKGLFGLSKPVFGNYTTLDITKLDSGSIKKKTRDSSSLDFETSGEGGTDIDYSKFLTIKKSRLYKLRLVSNSDTAKAIFSIASESKEKRQTFLSKMLSKNDEGKDEVLNYNRDVPGTIITDNNSLQWQFFIGNFSRGSLQTSGFPFGGASISSGYLRNEKDSLNMQLYSSFSADLVLVNTKGEYVAALKFKYKPLYIWIRNDIDNSYQQAIAALFVVIIGIKDF